MSQQQAVPSWNGWKGNPCQGWRRCALRPFQAAVIAFATVLYCGGASAQETIGQKIFIDPATLPPPYATESVANSAEEIALPRPVPLHVPQGFAVTIFAEGLDHARNIVTAPNGDILVAESDAGKITWLRDSDGDGTADARGTVASGLRRPYGMAFLNNILYIADTVAVWVFDSADLGEPRSPRQVTPPGALGTGSGHSTRNLVFDPNDQRFYVAIGSAGNIGEEPLPRASIQSFAIDGSDQKTFAAGLRNPVGLAFYPGTHDLYTVVNERDGLGDGLVPDYLTRVTPDGFYGWPYAYIGQHPQPGFEKHQDKIAASIVPDLLFRAHSAPLGLVFYTGTQFPPDYRGDAFVALHGSWNSGDPTGYMVVRVPFKNNRPAGWYEPFLMGFRLEGSNPAKVFGRPVGLTIANDGALLIADDVGQRIWRVAWKGQ